MKLKICGVRNKAMFDFCELNEVDFMGFNFVTWSKRKLENFDLLNLETKNSKKVALFMDQSLKEVQAILTKFCFDVVQLHGNESLDFLEKIKKQFPKIEIWKAFGIDENFSNSVLQESCKNSDKFLFDGETPGSGNVILASKKLQEAIDFSEKLDIPYGIAGGIKSETISNVKKSFPKASFLDTASGVEKDGNFDINTAQKLIKNFKK